MAERVSNRNGYQNAIGNKQKKEIVIDTTVGQTESINLKEQ